MNENFQHTDTEDVQRSSVIRRKILKLAAAAVGTLAAAAIAVSAVIPNKESNIDCEPTDPDVTDISAMTEEIPQELLDTSEGDNASDNIDNSESETAEESDADAADEEEASEPARKSISENTATNGNSEDYFCVYVKADGKTYKVKVRQESTVDDILDKVGIDVTEDDIISMDTDITVSEDDKIIVDRVEYVTETETLTLDYETEYRDDDNLPEGTTEVLVYGSEGEAVIETKTKYVNGVEESSEIISRSITKHTIDEVVLVGTAEPEDESTSEPETVETAAPENEYVTQEEAETEETAAETEAVITVSEPVVKAADPNAISRLEVPASLMLDENGIPLNYTEVFTGESCAYTADPDALMSTGKTVFQGYVAVDPKLIPYGSELYIVADDGTVYGYAIAADTGYSVRAGHIIVDLFMSEYDDCIQWGRKNVTIYVLSSDSSEDDE
ncbi:MAG: G5 domain-containing protein [Huintestinicola sp.]